MVNKRNKQEYELFSKLSDEWWDENGKFRVLHQIRPIRIQYILDQFNNQNIADLFLIYGIRKSKLTLLKTSII